MIIDMAMTFVAHAQYHYDSHVPSIIISIANLDFEYLTVAALAPPNIHVTWDQNLSFHSNLSRSNIFFQFQSCIRSGSHSDVIIEWSCRWWWVWFPAVSLAPAAVAD